MFASKPCEWGLESFGKTWINRTRSWQIYAAFPARREPCAHPVPSQPWLRMNAERNRDLGQGGSWSWELASPVPCSELGQRGALAESCAHPCSHGWSVLSLFLVGGGRRCSSLTQTFIWDVSYSVVWKCKVFYVWCCIKTVSENISVEKKNQTMKLVSCYIPVRAKFGLNFGYRSNLSLSGTYFGQQKRMLEKSEVILSEA